MTKSAVNYIDINFNFKSCIQAVSVRIFVSISLFVRDRLQVSLPKLSKFKRINQLHGVKVGLGPRHQGPPDPGTHDLGRPQSLK